MHIVLIISSLTAGGAERVLSDLANAWVLQGHKISIITLSGASVPPFYPLNDRIRLHPLDALQKENCTFLQRLKNIAKRLLTLRKALRLVKPDVIISFVDIMNVTALFASLGLKIPIIVGERTHPQYYQLPRFYKKLRGIAYRWAGKVVSQTPSASDYFSKLPRDKRAVIPNSVKIPKHQKNELDILSPVQKIISVGRLCPNKGFGTLIAAFSEIAQQSPNLTLTIYGEGAERQNLEALIQNLNLATRVFLPGTVQDIEEVLCQSDLFVFPSHYEGFPNALCEAMAVGLPVIASNCSGNIDIIREGVDGRLFRVGDTLQLARLMRELVDDAPQRLKLSKGALSLPDRFSQGAVLQMWDEVLAEVMGSLSS